MTPHDYDKQEYGIAFAKTKRHSSKWLEIKYKQHCECEDTSVLFFIPSVLNYDRKRDATIS